MSNEEIIEGNKLIAEFMGAEYERKKDFFNPEIMREFIYFMGIPHMNYKDKDCRHQYTPATCGYHFSWDWLIPVVEKITELDITPAPNWTGYRVEIVPRGYVKINGFPMPPILKNVSIEGSLINAVWKAIVEFIKYYKIL